MKAILEFTLPNEDEEFMLAKRGIEYMCALEDMYMFLRNKLKYEDLDPKKRDIYEEVNQKFFTILNERCIDL